jgi:hypothetical protein
LKLDTWSHYPIHAADIRRWRAEYLGDTDEH